MLTLGEGYSSNLAQRTLSQLTTGTPANNGGSALGVHFRTLGNVAYFITSLNTLGEATSALQSRILNALQSPPS